MRWRIQGDVIHPNLFSSLLLHLKFYQIHPSDTFTLPAEHSGCPICDDQQKQPGAFNGQQHGERCGVEESPGHREAPSSPREVTLLTSFQTETFPLLSLPSEIWSAICKLAFIEEKAIWLIGKREEGEYQDGVYQPPITRVCRLIRDEALPFFYSLNTFIIRHEGLEMRGLIAWTRAIGFTHLEELAQLHVLSRTTSNFKQYVERLRGVHEVPLQIREAKPSGYHGSKLGPNAVEDGVRALEDSKGDARNRYWKFHLVAAKIDS